MYPKKSTNNQVQIEMNQSETRFFYYNLIQSSNYTARKEKKNKECTIYYSCLDLQSWSSFGLLSCTKRLFIGCNGLALDSDSCKVKVKFLFGQRVKVNFQTNTKILFHSFGAY